MPLASLNPSYSKDVATNSMGTINLEDLDIFNDNNEYVKYTIEELLWIERPPRTVSDSGTISCPSGVRRFVVSQPRPPSSVICPIYKSGDEFYRYGGVITLPIGTITIQESKAPENYELNPDLYIGSNSKPYILDDSIIRTLMD